MKDSFFVSDTHFGHTNIIRYSQRPFASVEEHDETLIRNWNGVVKQGDDVYFLGDFSYKSKEAAYNTRKRLNGNIYFIRGNHDKSADQIKHTFIWYKDVHKVTIGDYEVWCSHYAHRVWNKSHHGVVHAYGHSHGSLPDDPNSMSFDVGIDNTAMRLGNSPLYGTGKIDVSSLKPENYRPISLDEFKAVMATKTFRPIDHHTGER